MHVSYDGALYSVPWQLKSQQVWVMGTSSSVLIFDAQEQRRATHPRGKPGSRNTIEDHLPEGRRDLRHRSREYWEKRAEALGPEVLDFVKEVFDADEVLYQLRTVQAIVTYLERFPAKRARAACVRAKFFGSYTYRSVKRILEQALDLEPLPTAVIPGSPAPAFRFARSVDELVQARIEDRHEPN